MATVKIDQQNLKVELGPWDHIWAFSGSLTIPLAHVKGVEIADEAAWSRVWTKLVGTSLPGMKTAGTFFSKDGMVFCDYNDGNRCLEISVEHEFYSKLVIQLDEGSDPEAVRTQIQAALKR
ncbi:MAG: hypothetical protein GIW97_04360 [Candidatus Eremiobacteraeota bacterium]|nr:hypothetical protein [Candidatus Eremiobacteraeota bacterium]